MNEEEMKRRTKKFALRVIKLCESLPDSPTGHTIKRQLLRAGTSVGANYRAVCRGKSTPDFIYKLSIVEEEADECLYWMELLVETGLVKEERLSELMKEADEIVAMIVSSIKKARKRL